MCFNLSAAVKRPLSGVHWSLHNIIFAGISLFESPFCLPYSLMALLIVFSMLLFVHNCSKLRSWRPNFSAKVSTTFWLGTTKAIRKSWIAFPWTQMLSTNWQLLTAASIFSNEKYSPFCSFNKSFRRSMILKEPSLSICSTKTIKVAIILKTSLFYSFLLYNLY